VPRRGRWRFTSSSMVVFAKPNPTPPAAACVFSSGTCRPSGRIEMFVFCLLNASLVFCRDRLVFWRERFVFCRDRPVFDLDSDVWFKDGEEGPGIADEGTARELCDVSVFARVRETLLALREGGPTKSDGAGRR